MCSSLVTLHPITLQNGWGEDSATAHSDDATGHRVVQWVLGGGAGEGVSPVSDVWGAVDSTPSDHYQFAYGLLSFLGGPSPYYQAEEEFETKDSFLALSNVSSSR